MNNCYRNIIHCGLLWLICAATASAQSPQIERIEPFVANDTLAYRINCANLFSGNVRQTLFSGLPVLIELNVRLLDENDKLISLVIHKYRLTYDIWEDRYLQENPGENRAFTSLEALEKWWNPRDSLIIAPVKTIADAQNLAIQLNMRIILLTRTQGQKLKDWVFNTNETEENLPGSNRDTGFKLDLNRLVSLFFRRSDVIEQISISKISDRFSIETPQKWK